MQFKKKDLEEISQFLYREIGVRIKEEKFFLIKNRLSLYLKNKQISCARDYLHILKQNEDELNTFYSKLTTHKTSFFRESNHFEILKKWIQEKASGKKVITFICAACSSGEEAYTLALILESLSGKYKFDYRILAFDICTKSIQTAQAGIYERINDTLLSFKNLGHYELDQGRVIFHQSIKSKIKFRVMNLVSLNFPKLFTAEVIFLRNVLIYFDQDSTQKVLKSLAKHHQSGGYLFLGMSEHIESQLYRSIGNSIYEKCA